MEDLQLALTAGRVDQRNYGLWINNWQIGQTLNALVTNQLPSGELVLRVGGQQITATSDIPIQQGARLLLEVSQTQPLPTLRVLNPTASAAGPAAGGTLQLLSGASAAAASPPLANVVQALQASQSNAAVLPLLADSVTQLLRQVSSAGRVTTADGLARAIADSGVFMESSLRAGKPPASGALQSDLKAGLFRALSRVDAAIGRVDALQLPAADVEALLDMKRDLEAGLGRITLSQLNSQPAADSQGNRQWQFEIPVQWAGQVHSLRVEIEKDGAGQGRDRNAGDEEDPWQVKLSLAPAALGAIEIGMQLRGEQLSLRLAAARDDVRQLMDAGLPVLAEALKSRGLSLQTTATASLSATQDPSDDSDRSTLDLHA